MARDERTLKRDQVTHPAVLGQIGPSIYLGVLGLSVLLVGDVHHIKNNERSLLRTR